MFAHLIVGVHFLNRHLKSGVMDSLENHTFSRVILKRILKKNLFLTLVININEFNLDSSLLYLALFKIKIFLKA